MIEAVEGIILSANDYSETSKIINIITKKYGIIGVMCKGSRSLKSSLRSVTDRLTYGLFYIYYKPDKLSILSSVDVINSFKNVKKSIDKISYSYYILELSGQVMKQTTSNIYDLLINSLIKIEEGYDCSVIMNILELKYLDYLGIMPIIDSCAKCGRGNSIATISAKVGGYICNSCLTNEKLVSEKTIKLLRMFYYVDISKISNISINKETMKEINVFLDEYYDYYAGLYLKSKNFIKNLNKLNS